ncbi:MAG: response regulator transcription factor [Clostridia bacterium]|nr:response regulator transcription factor [Clostridia bacterium]
MIRIAVCDDSVMFLHQIKQNIDSWKNAPASIHLDVFENGDSLIRAHSNSPYDIILLDIVMPLINGLETAKEIREKDKNVKLVFLTSSPEFALESYSVKASNYILKPLDHFKFTACLTELIEEIKDKQKCIHLKSGDTFYRVELSVIEYAEAQNKNVLFYLSDGRCIKTAEPLYTYEKYLNAEERFFKCHRSYIVNMDFINTYTQKEIKMHSGDVIPISRNSAKDFENAYFSAVFGKADGYK